MGKALIYNGAGGKTYWEFVFFPNDAKDNRAHIHVGKQNVLKYCKIWLEPDVSIDKVGTIENSDLKTIVILVKKYRSLLLKQWYLNKQGNCNVKKITIKRYG